MRPALESAGHWVPQTKPTCLLHTWRPHLRRLFTLVLHLHQHQSSRNLHLQYLARSESTKRCQTLITLGNDHPPVFEPHTVLNLSRLFFTCTNTSQAATCTCNTQSTPRCQSLITPESDHPPVLKPHMALRGSRVWGR
jgi:hypothetical protein